MRRRWIVGVALGATIALAGGAAWVLWGSQTAPSASGTSDEHSRAVATAPVIHGSVAQETQLSGTLQFSDQHAILAGLSGVVTGLPAVGATIGLGQTLFTVSNRPVVLFHGGLPVWRSFERGMDPGPDVAQLEQNLATLGHFTGDVDAEFTAATARGISAWQKASGQPATGSLERGSVVFSSGDIRVASLTSAMGAEVGAASEIMTASADLKIVMVDVKLSDQALAIVGAAVTVVAPNGTPIAGSVSSVGPPVEKTQQDGGGAAKIVIPVVIALDDQAAIAEFQRASVTVTFSSVASDSVLTVPVEALIALDDELFGVEVVVGDAPPARVPVTTGLFAAGRVVIAGEGIAEGVVVVVPER
ncbi:peptidoglycan-binding protein [Leifsonia sp. YAF41]|uniref:peptidoglycan-binding protein n=1 Tax=Leifsonia sp. YAF41 TaxID=3233086 RepID=UPI003F9EB79B